jgi:hypothetical protein
MKDPEVIIALERSSKLLMMGDHDYRIGWLVGPRRSRAGRFGSGMHK